MNRRVLACAAALLVAITMSARGAATSALADAAMKGDKAAIRTLLAQKADVNAPQVDGATALHWAIYRDDEDVVDLLIRSGANVKAVNRDGVTPLAMASLYGKPAMILKLLKAGADAAEVGPNGQTVLMLAARNGNPDAVKVLIEGGAKVNARESIRGTTALMWAAEQRHPEAVEALLASGADPGLASGSAGLPRNYMAPRVDVRAVEAARARRQRAAAAGRTYDEQVVIERRAPPAGGGQNTSGAVPDPSVDGDDVAVQAGLVGKGGGGLTALVFAAREGDIDSAKALVGRGAKINQTTEYGWTPLLTAINNRNYALAQMLIDRGADVNLANKGGWTPLYLATDNRNIEGGDYPVPKPDLDHLEIIRSLLQHGANPNGRVRDNTLTRTIFTMQWFFEDGDRLHPCRAVERHRADEAAARVQGGSHGRHRER